MRRAVALNAAGEDQRDVVRLLGRADPILYGRNHMLRDPCERQVTMGSNGFDQAIFAELSKFIFRLGNAVTKSDENIAGIEFHGLFFVVAVREKTHNGAAVIEPADGTIAREDNRRKVAGVGVGQAVLNVVIESETERGVFFRLSALEE